MAVILLLVLIGIGVWYYRGGRKLMSRSGSGSLQTSSTATRSFENPYFNQEVTMSNLQASDVAGYTLSEAVSTNSNASSAATQEDDIPMEAMEDESEGRDSKKKWPKIPGSGNNGFGFQRFQ